MDTPIVLQAPGAELEGRLRIISRTQAVVITHPHPLYGGDMDNSVVSIIADSFALKGWSVLRFNFRGTGRSRGTYEEGIDEQQDVGAAIEYLKTNAFQRVCLAGYSFGTWVLAGWAKNHGAHPHPLFLVAPPVAFMDFDCHSPIPGLRHIIAGSLDDLAPPEKIVSALQNWAPQCKLSVIQGADHSFWGHFQTLQREITNAIP